MLRFKNWSLASRILIPTLVISFLLLCGFGATVIQERRKAAVASVENKVTAIATFLGQAAASYISTYDLQALKDFVTTITNDPDFKFLTFYGKEGKALLAEPPEEAKTYPFRELEIKKENDKVGTLKLYYKPVKLIGNGDFSWLLVLIGIIAVEAVLGAAVFFVVRGAVNSFTTQFGSLGETSNVLQSASAHLQSGTQELSSVFDEQVELIRSTVTTLDQISAVANSSKVRAQTSVDLAGRTRGMVQDVHHRFETMVQSVESLNKGNKDIVTEIHSSLQRLGEVVQIIEQIESKTEVINEIVFQTRLLSFNASVEAARAGEAGRGFSIVAEEVGNLAKVSGGSSQEISKLLETSTARVSEIINDLDKKVKNAISNGQSRADSSMRVAEECKAVISTTVNQIGEFADSVQQFSTAFEEQAKAVDHINQSINQIHQSSETSLERLRASMNTSVEVKERSLNLVDIVSSMESEVYGQKAA